MPLKRAPDYAPGENWPDREPVVVMQGGERVKWLKGPECRRTTLKRPAFFAVVFIGFTTPLLSARTSRIYMCYTESRKTKRDIRKVGQTGFRS